VARRKINLDAEFDLIGQAEQSLCVLADYLDSKRGHEIAHDGLACLRELRKRLLPHAERSPEEIAAATRVRRTRPRE
jgi:hypothetical protein